MPPTPICPVTIRSFGDWAPRNPRVNTAGASAAVVAVRTAPPRNRRRVSPSFMTVLAFRENRVVRAPARTRPGEASYAHTYPVETGDSSGTISLNPLPGAPSRRDSERGSFLKHRAHVPALAAALSLMPLLASPARSAEETLFLRGDANGSGVIDLSDAIRLLRWLFLPAQPEMECIDAADANDDCDTDMVDAMVVLLHSFGGGAAPAFPYPECG